MKKTLSIIKAAVTWVIVILAVSMMIFTFVSVLTFDRTDRSIFGYKAFIVLSDSMKATDFEAGDLVISKEVDPATLKEGDIITFQSIDPDSYGEIITHKIRKLTRDADGAPGFVTYGTTNNQDDGTVVTYSFVLGKYMFRLPGVGQFFKFLKTTPGYIICILIPFLALILMQGYNSIKLFRRYKQEQMEELTAERERIEEERLESQKMMQELLALREQLKNSTAADAADTKKRERPSSAGAADTDKHEEPNSADTADKKENEESRPADAESTKASEIEKPPELTQAKKEGQKELALTHPKSPVRRATRGVHDKNITETPADGAGEKRG